VRATKYAYAVGGTSDDMVLPTAALVRTYCATTRLDLADCGPDPALLLACTVNR